MKIYKQILCSFTFVVFLAMITGTAIADNINVELAGHLGGAVQNVAVAGSYAYLGQGHDLVILNINDATDPSEIGRVNTSLVVSNVAVAGDYAYVADHSNDLVIVDVSNQTSPTLVGSYNTAASAEGNNTVSAEGNTAGSAVGVADNEEIVGDIAEGITIAGDYAYVADFNNGLVIVDVSNKTSPTLAGSYNIAGSAVGVAVAGNYAYVTDFFNGLAIVDISNQTSPTLAGSYNTAGNAGGVAVAGNYAYVADFNNGLVIVDVSNKTSPALAGSYNTAGSARGVAVAGNYAYVADDRNGLVIVDVSNKTSPTLAGSYNTAGYALDVAVADNYAYIADFDNGLVIVDVSNQKSPTIAGSYGTASNAFDVAVAGDYAYVTDFFNGLAIVDISNQTSPTIAGSYNTAGSAGSVAVAGNYAYVADDRNGLVIVDVSNQTSPILAGSYDTAGSAEGITVAGNYAYVADYSNGLVIVDVSNQTSPTLAGSYNTAGYAWGVAVAGNYAYVADDRNGLVIVDVSNKTSPTLAGSYNTAGRAADVAIAGNYAYVADYSNGLAIVDVSNQTSPTLAGSYDTAGNAGGVAIAGNYAYVADNINGLVIVDVSNQTSPTLAGSYDTAGCAYGVAVAGNYAYIADSINGLVILKTDVQNQTLITVGEGASTPEITQKFIEAYNRNGGLSVLGNPTTKVHSAFGFEVQDFPEMPANAGGVIMYNPNNNTAYFIHGAIWDKYYDYPEKARLGAVAKDEEDAAVRSEKTTGRYTKFETGTIHWISDKTGENLGHPQRGQSFVTYGDLDKLYTDMGGTYSYLGFPIMDQKERSGHGYCEFEGGNIVWDVTEGKYSAYTIKSKIFIEDAPSGIVVNKAPGDITHVVLEIENTGDTTQSITAEFDYPLLETPPTVYSRNDFFDDLQANPDLINIEIEPHKKKQIIWQFELPSYMIPMKVEVIGKTFGSNILLSENSGRFNVVHQSEGIIVTNRKLLYEKFGKNSDDAKNDTISLLNTLYTISDGSNEKEINNVVYYVDRYDDSVANWNQEVNYDDKDSINKVAVQIDKTIEDKQKVLQSSYLTIVGGDEIIPFYRLNNPDSQENHMEEDTGSKDPVLEIVNHNHIPTDNIYSDVNGNGWDEMVEPELSIGRISSATSKDMEFFIKNSLKGPSANSDIAIVATVADFSGRFYDGDVTETLSNKGLEIKYISGKNNEVIQKIEENTKENDYRIWSYIGHSSYNRIGQKRESLTGNPLHYLNPVLFNDRKISQNNPLFTFGSCRAGIVTDENDMEWNPHWVKNIVWSLSRNGASAILASGSYSALTPKFLGAGYASETYNNFYKYLYQNSETTTPIGEALKEAEINYDIGRFDGGADRKARVQFILYSLPWMTFDPPVNPTESLNKDYIVSFSKPEKIDNNSYKVLATIDVNNYNLTSVDVFNLITINGSTNNLKDFKPILPVINVDMNLPVSSEISEIRVLSENEIDLGNLNIPSFQSTITSDEPKPSLINISDISGVFPSPRFITTDVVNQGYKNVKINVAPVQYNIDTHETILFNKTVLEIIYRSNDSVVITDFLSLNNKFGINDLISTNVTIENINSEPLENVHYEFSISDLFGNVVESHNSSEFNIPVGVNQYEANASTQNLQQGSYLAEIEILNSTGYIFTNSSEYVYLTSGEIANFTINTTSIEQGEDLELKSEFENFNETNITICGQISISDSENNLIDRLQIPETTVLSNNSVEFNNIWYSGNNDPGLYKAELTLSSESSDYGLQDQWFTIKNFYNLSFLSPLSAQGFYNVASGSNLPICFTSRDYSTGDFINDNSVNISILDVKGSVLTNFNTTNGVLIDSDKQQYYVNLNTADYPDLHIGKTYTVRVNFGTVDSKKSTIDAYFSLVDVTPPSSITNLQSTKGITWLNWTWTNPTDSDFNHTEIYLNNIFQTNISAEYFNATNLEPDTNYTISTHTADTYGNVNETWVNASAKTEPLPDIAPPVIESVILFPTNTIPDSTINVTVNVTDNVGVDEVKANDIQLLNQGENLWNGSITAIEGTHSVNVSATDGEDNVAWNNSTVYTAIKPDLPPSSVSNLQFTNGTTWLNWTWINPTDLDFNHTEIYLDGIFQINTSAEYFNATGLEPDTSYTLGTRTVDNNGNVNETWVNSTAKTKPDIIAPVIESAIIFPVNTTAGSKIGVTVNATDNIRVTSVTADDVQLTTVDGLWKGNVTAPSSTGKYSLLINASDAAGNSANASVPYSVVRRQGRPGIGVSPEFGSVVAGKSSILNIKVKNNQNVDDTFRIQITNSGYPSINKASLSWFNWTEKTVDLRAKKEIRIPVQVNVPAGITPGVKLFKASVNSERYSVRGSSNGYLILSRSRSIRR